MTSIYNNASFLSVPTMPNDVVNRNTLLPYSIQSEFFPFLSFSTSQLKFSTMSEPSKERVVETARSDFAKSTKSLKAVRQSRLQLQKEAQLLQNRLRVLKLEEARARKRIHIAREKAVKILEIRREQDEEIELRLGAKKKESRRRKLLRKKLRIDRELIKSQILVRTFFFSLS